jgi:hypothetical protein
MTDGQQAVVVVVVGAKEIQAIDGEAMLLISSIEPRQKQILF